MVDDVLKDVRTRMDKAVQILRSDLMTMRTGRASPALLEKVKVDYYGSLVPLNQIASISAPEPRLLVVRPWDINALPAIEKAILKSDLGLNPMNDGKVIRISIPRLTEERRKELVKVVSKRLEEAKVAVRNCRRDGLEELRELQKEKMITEDEFFRAKDKLQEITDEFIKKIDELGEMKKKEIMEV
ncbi:MAG: ribosome recycling factor [Chloroflexi bacterium]|nr:MAG: ribosome recycling factor [Chloroflexota bacterium]HDN79979.1 ribosome recycling factor [Chloroflexota bacterium]